MASGAIGAIGPPPALDHVGREGLGCRIGGRGGVGFGVCQNRLAARDPDLVAVLPDAFHFDLDTWIVMHEDLRRVRRVRLVYEALAKGLTAYIKD